MTRPITEHSAEKKLAANRTGIETLARRPAVGAAGTKVVYHVKVFADNQIVLAGDGRWILTLGLDTAGMTLQRVRIAVTTVSSSGIIQVQFHNLRLAADMLSTLVQIDATEFNSADAATAYVINLANDDVLDKDRIRFDVDAAGNNAKGLEVELLFNTP